MQLTFVDAARNSAVLLLLIASLLLGCGHVQRDRVASSTSTPALGIDLRGGSRLEVTQAASADGPVSELRADSELMMHSLRSTHTVFALEDGKTTIGRSLGEAEPVLYTWYEDAASGSIIEVRQSKAEFDVIPPVPTNTPSVLFAGYRASFWSEPYQEYALLRPQKVEPMSPSLVFVRLTLSQGQAAEGQAELRRFLEDLR